MAPEVVLELLRSLCGSRVSSLFPGRGSRFQHLLRALCLGLLSLWELAQTQGLRGRVVVGGGSGLGGESGQSSGLRGFLCPGPVFPEVRLVSLKSKFSSKRCVLQP